MWQMPWRGIELATQKKAADSLGTVSIPTVLNGRHLGSAASRLFAAGWSRCVIRMQIFSVHPFCDETIVLMPDKNFRFMTAISVLFGPFYCCTQRLRFAWKG